MHRIVHRRRLTDLRYSQDMNYTGSTCICRIPKAHLRSGTVIECSHCGKWTCIASILRGLNVWWLFLQDVGDALRPISASTSLFGQGRDVDGLSLQSYIIACIFPNNFEFRSQSTLLSVCRKITRQKPTKDG